MKNPWLKKKNEPATDYDEDYDSMYYGKSDPDEVTEETAEQIEDTVEDTEDGDVSEVRVAWSEDDAEEVATVEPLRKKTFTPKTCQDSRAIVEAYRDGKVVVICVEELDRENFLRLFDYVMGAVHALDGELSRIDRDTVVLLPYGTEEDIDVEGLEEEEIIEEEPAEENE
jgi:cell division inhibitor SepF